MDWERIMADEDFEDLPGLTELARSISPEDRVRHEPPPEIWDKIEAGVRREDTGDVDAAEVTHDSRVSSLDEQRATTAADADASNASRGFGRVLLVAAASALVLIVGASLAIASIGSDPNTVFSATFSNDDLPEPFDGTASVILEIDDDPMLVFDFDDELPAGEPIEVWILTADGSEIAPVGTVQPGDTTWDWPEGFDPVEYPLVDFSIEPDDGDPTHSGRSILRGQLSVS